MTDLPYSRHAHGLSPLTTSVAESLWKPFLHRAVTGRWRRFRMRPMELPLPTGEGPDALVRPGLYLHVPFCRQLCPFCPYHRVEYDEARFARYERAVMEEIDLVAPGLAGTEFVSLYIGGGTPTENLPGLLRILARLRAAFRIAGPICIELHPKSMDTATLAALRGAGVQAASVGVESTSDRLLELLGRGHSGGEALAAVGRARAAGFAAVNVDLMFALPTEALDEWQTDLDRVLALDVDQVSTYPLFGFPYSDLGRDRGLRKISRPPGREIRAMLDATNARASAAGLTRCAVWSWLRPGRWKFSSITRHHTVGLGPSAATMTRRHFSVNVFDVDAYADCLPRKRPTALVLEVDRRLEMAYWLYWRVYELRIGRNDFATLFPGESLDAHFGALFAAARAAGMVRQSDGGYEITPRGAYWIHRVQNEYSLNYINRLWGACRREAWPREVAL